MPFPLTLATVLLDPPTALLFGCAIALVSANLIRADPATEVGRTALLGAGWSLFYGLCVGWFYFTQPDWMLAYLKDAREVALVPTYVLFVAILVAHGAAGAFAAATLLARGRRALAWALTAGALLTLAGVFGLQWKQYFLVGTYEQFHTGAATPLQEMKSMQLAMNLSGAAAALGAIPLLVLRWVRGRKTARS